MQSGFTKFRKKQARITLINSLIWGIATTLLAVGGLLLTAKLLKKSLPLFLYVLIPVCSFAAAWCICYFLSRSKDDKLAKRLDKEFALNDRVQTMIEFQDKQTPMIRLQRTDAQARLEATSLSKFKWKGLWACLTALVCAAAIFVTGLALPKTEAEGDDLPPAPPEIVFEITDLQKTKLARLIQNVKESKAEDVVKTTIVAELEGLQLSLDEIETANELYEKIAAVIVTVDEFVEQHNTYKRVYEEIRANKSIALHQLAFGVALNDLPARIDMIKAELSSETDKIKEELSSEMDEKSKTSLAAIAAITAFVNDLRDSLAILDENETDGLMVAFTALIEDLTAVANLDYEKYAYDTVFDELTSAFNNHVKAIETALNQQTENRTVTSDVIERLIVIFNVPSEKIPFYGGTPLEGLEGSGNNDDEEVVPGDGIIIDGTQYPSNETIYDYYIKVICEYGQVFENEEHAHNYKKEINDLISTGVANGTITPELEEMLRSYLDALSGSKATGNEQ